MHAWDLAGGEIDFDEHSAIVAVGGDGTLHEVINGVLQRADKKRLPISFVPNGSGNDLCKCFGIRDSAQALDWLVKGDIIKMDANKCLLDCEHEDEIPQDAENRSQKIRYSVINAAVGFVAKSVHKAISHKPIAGRACYFTSAVHNFFTTSTENYGVVIS